MQKESSDLVATPKGVASRQYANLTYLREAAGVSLEQISDSTKIGKGFLTAIEEGRFNDLPGGVFTRSYIRQYAAAIGCDAEPILETLAAISEAPARQVPQRETPNALVRFFSLG